MGFVQGGGSTVTSTSRNITRKTRRNFASSVNKTYRPPSTTTSGTTNTTYSGSSGSYGGSTYSGNQPSTYTTTQRTSAADRAASRQEARDEHRQYVEGVRGRNAELRRDRNRSLLNPVENSMLGSPWGFQDELPRFIGERWNRGANQSINDITWTPIEFGNSDVTADSVGYGKMYDDASPWGIRIPSGLDGVWLICVGVRWASNSTGTRAIRVRLNAASNIIDHSNLATAGNLSMTASMHYVLAAGDVFTVDVRQSSGGALNVLGGADYTFVSYQFAGTGGN